MSVTSDTADLTAKFQQAVGELTIQDPHPARLHQRLTAAAAPLGFSVYVGTIALVGQDSSGNYQVQFNDTSANTGYSRRGRSGPSSLRRTPCWAARASG